MSPAPQVCGNRGDQGFCDLDRDGIGIVLIGNSEIYDRLKGRQEALFAQQFSRIRFPRRYTTRDIKDDDVKLLFPLLAEQRKEKELQFLGGVCRSKWGIRGAVNVYRNAVDNDDIATTACTPEPATWASSSSEEGHHD